MRCENNLFYILLFLSSMSFAGFICVTTKYQLNFRLFCADCIALIVFLTNNWSPLSFLLFVFYYSKKWVCVLFSLDSVLFLFLLRLFFSLLFHSSSHLIQTLKALLFHFIYFIYLQLMLSHKTNRIFFF